jgi:hypothetical protein
MGTPMPYRLSRDIFIQLRIDHGYVKRSDGGPATNDWINAGSYELEVASQRYAASATLRAPYDPSNTRIRA